MDLRRTFRLSQLAMLQLAAAQASASLFWQVPVLQLEQPSQGSVRPQELPPSAVLPWAPAELVAMYSSRAMAVRQASKVGGQIRAWAQDWGEERLWVGMFPELLRQKVSAVVEPAGDGKCHVIRSTLGTSS